MIRQDLTNHRRQQGKAAYIVMALLGMLTLIAVFMLVKKPDAQAEVITREGVITEIQSLSRLQTAAFGVETIVTANKDGTWQALWQDKQRGLFVIKGRVLAGIDLSAIGSEMVHISESQNAAGEPIQSVHITLPPSEIFEVFLDNIEVYDWQTGLFGAVAGDPALFAKAQADAKAQVLSKACQGDVLTLAMTNAAEQVKNLFMLTGAQVEVSTQGTGACQLPSS
ncbi:MULTISPECIES: DUF4230 domain-containing protein [Moraxella]|uniref:DUF4230 domain-containing protein n=1 Tax=Moraxella catarrhalis TaxID=480 RepID=A0A7Z1A4Q5_MORCA|nr:DUF4230 domain-containing protein [Moraxella catarrhalis]OAV01680.1 hypothetical protein AO382_0046 [Moraxella catarrhalis]STY82373.1 Uncharacterised protein [Moraxella catarrhalis]